MRPGWRTGPERESLLVVLIALHSYLVGLVLLFASDWAVRFGHWETGGTLFFTRQGGAFHLIVATIYLWAYFRHRSTVPIVVAKSFAVAFLLTMSALGEPVTVLFSGIVDGLMLVTLLAVRDRS